MYVESEIVEDGLNEGYKADKAKLPVGVHDWSGGGKLILSRYDRPVRIVPWEEVANDWMEHFGDKGIHFDIIPPKLLPILTKRGANIIAPHKNMGKACNDAYELWKSEQRGQTMFSRIPRLDRYTVEESFGGIWISDQQEFAKFASAVEQYGIEENGTGVTYTDNHFYAYYRNINDDIIPYASVYLNRDESQDVVEYVNKNLKNDGRRIQRYVDAAIERFRSN